MTGSCSNAADAAFLARLLTRLGKRLEVLLLDDVMMANLAFGLCASCNGFDIFDSAALNVLFWHIQLDTWHSAFHVDPS